MAAGKYATRELILLTLAEHGPLCAEDIATEARLTRSAVDGAVHAMRGMCPRLIRIVTWKSNIGRGGRWGAVWALGPGPDAAPPVAEGNEARQARYREAHRAELRVKAPRMRAQAADNPFAYLVQSVLA